MGAEKNRVFSAWKVAAASLDQAKATEMEVRRVRGVATLLYPQIKYL